jgi:hypothetical protein
MHEALVGSAVYIAHTSELDDPRRPAHIVYALERLSDAIIHGAEEADLGRPRSNHFRYQLLHDTFDTCMADPNQPLPWESRMHLLERTGAIGREVMQVMERTRRRTSGKRNSPTNATTPERTLTFLDLSGLKLELAALAIATWPGPNDGPDGPYGVLAPPHLDLFAGTDMLVHGIAQPDGSAASRRIQVTAAPSTHRIHDGVTLITPHLLFGPGQHRKTPMKCCGQ